MAEIVPRTNAPEHPPEDRVKKELANTRRGPSPAFTLTRRPSPKTPIRRVSVKPELTRAYVCQSLNRVYPGRGFGRPPPARRAGLLRCRRGVARRADLTCINLGLTGTKAAYGKKSPKSENGAATLASRPGSAERGASGPGAFPAGGEGAAPPLPISVIFCHGRRVACAEPPSAGAGPGRRALRRPG